MIVDKKIIQERKAEYSNNFPSISKLWNNYLENHSDFHTTGDLTPQDAAIMMGLMKISRLAHYPEHEDSLTDLINYFYIGLNYDEYCGILTPEQEQEIDDARMSIFGEPEATFNLTQ